MRSALLVAWLLSASVVRGEAQECEIDCQAEIYQPVTVFTEEITEAIGYRLTQDGSVVSPPWALVNGLVEFYFLAGFAVTGVYTFVIEAILPDAVWPSEPNALTVIPPPDTTPPTIAITRLQRRGKSPNVDVTVTASDADSGLRRIDIWGNNLFLASCPFSPCGWSGRAPRGSTLAAAAFDQAGNDASVAILVP